MDTHADIDVRSIAPTVCKLLGVAAPDECEVESVPEVVQALAERPRIAVIVLDAVGIATLNLHREHAPFLMEQVDLNFLPMRAVFPTITPVNFASMATGVSPVTHSIRDRAETIIHDTVFDALRRGGRSSAVSARESSSLNLLLANKADTPIVSANNQDREVIDQVENLLGAEIPDFVWVQLLDMDDAQHKFGVINPSAAKALGKLDNNLKHLCAIFHDLEYGIIICADHGQHDKDDNSGGTHDGTAPEDSTVPLTWIA